MDGESTKSEPTLDVRVADVQNDVAHLVRRVDQTQDELKGSIAGVERNLKEMRVEQARDLKQTKDELKSDMHRIEEGLKSDIHGASRRS